MKEKLLRYLSVIVSTTFWHRVIAVLLLWLVVWFIGTHLTIFFFVFVFSYLFWEGALFIQKKLARNKINLSEKVIITGIYLIFISLLTFVLFSIIPKISQELSNFNYGEMIQSAQKTFEQKLIDFWIGETNNKISFADTISQNIFQQATLSKISSATAITFKWFLQIIISLILSYIYLLEKKIIREFISKIDNTYYRDIWDTYKYIGARLKEWFGYVFKAQAVIALFNTILTAIGIFLLWMVFEWEVFPMILTLSIIVFFFGFIPVLWTIFSSIPLMVVGFTFSGIEMVIAIIVLIMVVHAFEAYYLNPKIVWRFTNYPIFITLVVLYLWEHIMGPAGLILWMPLFIIIVSLLSDLNKEIVNIQHRYENLNTGGIKNRKQL